LDYGCGSGVLVSFLHSIGYNNSVGYDEYHSKFSDKKIFNEQYDFIQCQDVIEHAQDPIKLFREMTNLLKPNGIISIGTPNADTIDLTNPEKFLQPLHQPYHRHLFSAQALIQAGNMMGLKVKKIYRRYYLDFMFPFGNQKFGFEYVRRKGNVMEAVTVDKIDFSVAFTPKMLFYAFFGYFFSPQSEMEVIFQLSV